MYSAVTDKDFEDILHELDKESSIGDYRKRIYLGNAAILLRRWRTGDFLPEEIHNFCHKLDSTVSAKDFANGCMAYQTQLYGSSPVMNLLRETDLLLERWGLSPHDTHLPGGQLRAKIQSQIL